MSDPIMPVSRWIWTTGPYDKEKPVIVLFRRVLHLEEQPKSCKVRLSADSRYRFFVNGVSVCQGPVKGDRQVWYMDEVDLAPYLGTGENVLSAIVLRYPLLHENGNFSVWRTEYPGFYLDGDLTSEDFFCHIADRISVAKANPYFEPLCITEEAAGDPRLNGWQKPGYQAETGVWQPAAAQMRMNAFVSPFNLLPRPIPFLYETPRRFTEIMKVREGENDGAVWEAFVSDAEKNVVIPAHAQAVVELHAGELTTGYLELKVAGGAGAQVKILTSESYAKLDPAAMQRFLAIPQVQAMSENELQGILQFAVRPEKGDRLDTEGELPGVSDVYTVAGFGTQEVPETYEPFWFRTFRFIKLTVVTGDEPLQLIDLSYRETGYPLDVQTRVTVSDASLAPIWEISERTLRRCMHETYEDCPYYEQLQYVMDSRFQILATYMTSADDRLARKAIEDFARSQRFDGLVEGAYPSFGSNAIVNFSIFYILMVWDHWRFFGDRSFTIRFLPVLERIVQFYHDRLRSNGVVERTSEGGQDGRYWSFIDWVPAWERGVPTAILTGDSAIESLLYLLGLTKLADLEEAFEEEGWSSLAARHQAEAAALKQAIRDWFMDDEGLITDGLAHEYTDEDGHVWEAFTEHSQHGQVLATLTEVFTPEEARAAMELALDDASMHQCTVSWGYYLFRAMEKSGLYERTNAQWDLWRDMVRAHLTTCVENNGIKGRSDCHAWGALALYELPAATLGVQPAAPGFAKIQVHPVPGYLTHAQGQVITPKGMVHVSWTRGEDGAMDVQVQGPAGVEIV